MSAGGRRAVATARQGVAAAFLTAAIGAVGCTGAVGTIDVEVVAAPGSDLLARIQRARLTLTLPRRVIEAERDAAGELALSLELDAAGTVGFVELEGFDRDGERIAFGRTGPLPIMAVDASITIYLAPPFSVAEAPASLETPRAGIGAAPLPFGVMLAGGTDADGTVSDELVVYNVYQHELQAGEPLLQGPRHLPIVVPASGNFAGLVFLFGGLDGAGEPTGELVLFDSGAAPAGRYFALDQRDDLARAGQDAAALGGEQHLVLGDPPLQIDGLAGQVFAVAGAPALAGAAATARAPGRTEVVVLGEGAGETGVVVVASDGGIRELEAPPEASRTGHRGVALAADAGCVFAGGEGADGPEASAVVYDAGAGQLRVLEDFLRTPRLEPAVAATSTRILFAGGIDEGGAVVGDAELFDAATLEPLGVLPLVVPRRAAIAAPLANGQILIAGGVDRDGNPVAVIELFTPAE